MANFKSWCYRLWGTWKSACTRMDRVRRRGSRSVCRSVLRHRVRRIWKNLVLKMATKTTATCWKKKTWDFVSVCTWTELHHDMIVDAAGSGIQAIHAEKPMAPTWGEAKSLYQACVDNDVVITFCHQRRFAGQFIKAKEIAKSGAIGEVLRFEGNCPNMFDWGTHWFDMFFFYNDDEPAGWVIGQIDAEGGREVFGTPVEGSGISWIRYQNGREGLLATGGTGLQGCANRLVGSDGIIEVGGRNAPPAPRCIGNPADRCRSQRHGESGRCDNRCCAGPRRCDKKRARTRTFGAQSTTSNRIDFCNL